MTMEERVVTELEKAPMSNAELRKALIDVLGHDFVCEYSRGLDKELQRLRKVGKIRFDADYRRWMLATKQTCLHCGGKGWTE